MEATTADQPAAEEEGAATRRPSVSSATESYTSEQIAQYEARAEPTSTQFVGQLDHSWSRTPVPHGFKNEKNNCFINSVLQCLLNVAAFNNYLTRQHDREHPDSAKCLLCSLAMLAEECFTATAAISLEAFTSRVEGTLKKLLDGKQQDAHEFLINLFDVLTQYFTKGVVPAPDRQQQTTPLGQMFGVSFKKQSDCRTCGWSKISTDEFTALTLYVDRANNVEECLGRNMQPAIMEDERWFECKSCDGLQKAETIQTMDRVPSCLILHIARRADRRDNRCIVGNGEALNLSAYVSEDRRGGELSYTLRGVVEHSGESMNSGHYWAYVARPGDWNWYQMNDSRVRRVDWSVVEKCRPFLLFYVRNDVLPDRGQRPPAVPDPYETPGKCSPLSRSDCHDTSTGSEWTPAGTRANKSRKKRGKPKTPKTVSPRKNRRTPKKKEEEKEQEEEEQEEEEEEEERENVGVDLESGGTVRAQASPKKRRRSKTVVSKRKRPSVGFEQQAEVGGEGPGATVDGEASGQSAQGRGGGTRRGRQSLPGSRREMARRIENLPPDSLIDRDRYW